MDPLPLDADPKDTIVSKQYQGNPFKMKGLIILQFAQSWQTMMAKIMFR